MRGQDQRKMILVLFKDFKKSTSTESVASVLPMVMPLDVPSLRC
jgi:hypothetical protein